MSHHQPRVEVQWLGKTLSYGSEDLLIKFHHGALPHMVIHKSVLPVEERAGSARELLAAVASECMIEWIVILLKKAHVDIEALSVVAETIMGNDEENQGRVESVNMKVNLSVPDDQKERTNNLIERLLKKGCLVSRSLEKGIKMEYAYNLFNDKTEENLS